MAISQVYIDTSFSDIQTLHGRFSNELCNILKRHTGNSGEYYELISINNIIGKIKDILTDYIPTGNSITNDLTNGLTETEIQSLISYCYKVLNKYNDNIYLPTNPNIYL